MNSTGNVLIAVAVVALILARQFAPRPVRDNRIRLMLILGGIGLVETVQAVRGTHVSPTAGLLTALGLAVGAALGFWRARTMRYWRASDGRVWQRGTGLTALLWIVSIGTHLGLAALGHHAEGMATLDGATILLFVAVTFGAQQLAALHTVRLEPAPAG